MKHSIALMVIAAMALPVWAHEGVDHGTPAASPAASPAVGAMAPRTTAQTEEFELVAVLAEKHLTLYLDRFATNEPVASAQVEVESGAFKAVATQAAPGLYTLPGETFTHPGKYPLVISVQAGEAVDLLTATLEVVPPPVVAAPAQPWDARVVGGAAALLLVGAGFVAVRRRRPGACCAG
jgi:hypothetical protein